MEPVPFRDVLVLAHDAGEMEGLSFDPRKLHCGGNSGYQAVNLAVLMGATRIALLGYDMRFGPNGEKHWHADHRDRNPEENRLAIWARAFETMDLDLKRAGVAVVNCTPGSAIACFPHADINDVLGSNHEH